VSQVALPAPGAVGFYGKIAAERDFVRVNAGAFLRAGLDRWFQEAVEHLQGAQLPAEPACFLLSLAASAQPFIGTFAPGADAIGRAFPAAIFAALDPSPGVDVSLVPLRFASFLQAGARLAMAAPTLTANQLAAEIGALASGFRTVVQMPDVRAMLARSRCVDLGAALGGQPEAAAYALTTLIEACSQAEAPGSCARALVLDCPAPSDELRTFWLELVRRHLRGQMPSFLWTRDRLLVALGPAHSLMLAYLVDPEHEGSHRWPLRTLDPAAHVKAPEKLSPGQRRVLAAGDASLAEVLQIFAEA
jgi:type VI secretion system protein ImpM